MQLTRPGRVGYNRETVFIKPFNRTSLELKHMSLYDNDYSFLSFNRTSLELKHVSEEEANHAFDF